MPLQTAVAALLAGLQLEGLQTVAVLVTSANLQNGEVEAISIDLGLQTW